MNQPIFSMKMMRERLTQLELKVIPERAKRGLAAAGKMLMEDAVMGDPAMPVDTTSLIGSGTVFVEGEKMAASPYGVPGTQTRWEEEYGPREYEDFRASEDEPSFLPTGQFEAQIAFNAPYAQLRGSRQLSSKIGFFVEKYMDTLYSKINFGPEHAPDPNERVT